MNQNPLNRGVFLFILKHSVFSRRKGPSAAKSLKSTITQKQKPINTKYSHMGYKLNALLDLYKQVEEEHPSFCYRGTFLDRFTSTILDISEGAMASRNEKPTTSRKVSFLLVECFQNILRHSEVVSQNSNNLEGEGLFCFKTVDDTFVINSINYIQNSDRAKLKKLVDDINALEGEALKSYYMQHLSNNELSEKGGAGLGLIEIARKSGNKLLYEFEQKSESYDLFHQQVTFGTENKVSNKHYIESTKKIYQDMDDKNMFMYYKGDFSQRSIIPMLDIVEHNVGGGGSTTSLGRKAGHVLIELLQNVSKHNSASGKEEKKGIFTIGEDGDKFYIQCGNIVSHQDKVLLENKLELLSCLSKEDLRDFHRQAMKASIMFENKTRSGLGLIEIAKASSKPLEYIFEPLENNKYFYAIHVTI
jgi:hypothetical protein